MVDAGGGCIGWGARDRDLMRGTVIALASFPRTRLVLPRSACTVTEMPAVRISVIIRTSPVCVAELQICPDVHNQYH